MKRTELKELWANSAAMDGREVLVCGWIRTSRDSKNFGFIELNDGSCFKNVQVVLVADQLDCYKEIMRQNVGAALVVKGSAKLTPQAKQPFEIAATGGAGEDR